MKAILTTLLIIIATSVFSQKMYTVSDYITKKVSFPSEEYNCKTTDRMFISYDVDSTNCITINHIETTNEEIVPYFITKLKSTKFKEEEDSCEILITFKRQ